MNNELGNRNNFTGFIPHRLEVNDRPELAEFSQNILFANVFNSNGVDIVASSLYRPDLDTYHQREEVKTLTYRNIHNPDEEIRITRHPDRWEGEKFINGERALWASGGTWEQFFTQLTFTGLSKGERCKFEKLEDLLKQVKNS